MGNGESRGEDMCWWVYEVEKTIEAVDPIVVVVRRVVQVAWLSRTSRETVGTVHCTGNVNESKLEGEYGHVRYICQDVSSMAWSFDDIPNAEREDLQIGPSIVEALVWREQ